MNAIRSLICGASLLAALVPAQGVILYRTADSTANITNPGAGRMWLGTCRVHGEIKSLEALEGERFSLLAHRLFRL